MKKLLTKIKKMLSPKGLAATIVVAAAAVAGATLVINKSNVAATFGPDRPVKSYVQGIEGFSAPTFNSFINTPVFGDERYFLSGQQTGVGSFYDTVNVADGEEVAREAA